MFINKYYPIFVMKSKHFNMSIKTDYLLKALHVLAWIIFVGVSIEATAFITSTVATLALSPEQAAKFWRLADLSALYKHNETHFITLSSLVVIVAVLKAIMFYIIVMFFYNKNFNLSKPFSDTTRRMLLKLTYLTLGIGLFSSWGANFSDRLVAEGVQIPDTRNMKLGGADVWLFMSMVLAVLASIFKKGIEMQNENELTV